MKVDLKAATFEELKALYQNVLQEMKERLELEEAAIAERRSFLLGVSLQTNAKKLHGAAGVKVKPKYMSKDGKQTWAGRGMKPEWVKTYLEGKGAKIEDLLIKD